MESLLQSRPARRDFCLAFGGKDSVATFQRDGSFSGFGERKKKQLLPTEKGTELIKVMPDALKSAKLTAEWEERLGAVESSALACSIAESSVSSVKWPGGEVAPSLTDAPSAVSFCPSVIARRGNSPRRTLWRAFPLCSPNLSKAIRA